MSDNLHIASSCPKCGAYDTARTMWDGRKCGWYVLCIACGYRTETEPMAYNARLAWGFEEYDDDN